MGKGCKVEHLEDLKGCRNGSETKTGTGSGSRRNLCGLHRRTMYLADAIATTKHILDTTSLVPFDIPICISMSVHNH